MRTYEANEIYPSHPITWVNPRWGKSRPRPQLSYLQASREMLYEGRSFLCNPNSHKSGVTSIWHKILFTTSWYFILLRCSVLQLSMNVLTSDYRTMCCLCQFTFIMAWNADHPFISQAQILIVRYLFSSHSLESQEKSQSNSIHRQPNDNPMESSTSFAQVSMLIGFPWLCSVRQTAQSWHNTVESILWKLVLCQDESESFWNQKCSQWIVVGCRGAHLNARSDLVRNPGCFSGVDFIDCLLRTGVVGLAIYVAWNAPSVFMGSDGWA